MVHVSVVVVIYGIVKIPVRSVLVQARSALKNNRTVLQKLPSWLRIGRQNSFPFVTDEDWLFLE